MMIPPFWMGYHPIFKIEPQFPFPPLPPSLAPCSLLSPSTPSFTTAFQCPCPFPRPFQLLLLFPGHCLEICQDFSTPLSPTVQLPTLSFHLPPPRPFLSLLMPITSASPLPPLAHTLHPSLPQMANEPDIPEWLQDAYKINQILQEEDPHNPLRPFQLPPIPPPLHTMMKNPLPLPSPLFLDMKPVVAYPEVIPDQMIYLVQSGNTFRSVSKRLLRNFILDPANVNHPYTELSMIPKGERDQSKKVPAHLPCLGDLRDCCPIPAGIWENHLRFQTRELIIQEDFLFCVDPAPILNPLRDVYELNFPLSTIIICSFSNHIVHLNSLIAPSFVLLNAHCFKAKNRRNSTFLTVQMRKEEHRG